MVGFDLAPNLIRYYELIKIYLHVRSYGVRVSPFYLLSNDFRYPNFTLFLESSTFLIPHHGSLYRLDILFGLFRTLAPSCVYLVNNVINYYTYFKNLLFTLY